MTVEVFGGGGATLFLSEDQWLEIMKIGSGSARLVVRRWLG